MTTATASRTVQDLGDQCVVMHGIDWEGYTTMLQVRGDRSIPRMVYLEGSLFLMSPAYRHERLRERLGMLVSEIVLGLAIPCMLAGQTTFRRKGRRGGVEGDLSYYLANAIRVRGKEQIDLRVDPPPDLAIEVVHTHDATAAIEVYRRLAVPEVWVCDGEDIQILVRQHDGRFARSDQSAALPFLSGAEILGWVLRSTSDFDTEWGLEVRRWVQETLAPRHRARNPETTESR